MEQNIVDEPQGIPPIESTDSNHSSFLSQYVMVVSIFLIIGIFGIVVYLLLNKNASQFSQNSNANNITSPNCTNEKVYTNLTEALELPISQICYIDAKAPSSEYVFPSDIVKHENTRNLVSLTLNGYNLSIMRDSFEVLQNLKVLKLNNAKLTTLPPGINKISSLEILDLSGNKFNSEARQQILQQLPHVTVVF